MSWYIGTREECVAYDEKVTASQNYDGVYTKNWANPRQHPTDDCCCIIANSKVEPDEKSFLQIVEDLGEDWFPTEED